MTSRPGGFYWVKQDGRWLVAEWTAAGWLTPHGVYDDGALDAVGARIPEPEAPPEKWPGAGSGHQPETRES
jgi:hypothetical protein